ncbi:hypothetical protein SAMN05660473_02849 [Arthrobacter sp. 49Tsu3.1M3]|uniref:hypothetical protein n=1 Tax=Arthrobacter sp. 49Tsu3.1M3 TaxID=1279029 RepID=UPI0009A58B13|nr:hypothetical protein [Arthrobacter sp. 49Tsu3.1M3]SKB88403.1 hypothetical protein SAMN05660473_02849 [Arthrobacter sp. 49Tsu3.1M3]
MASTHVGQANQSDLVSVDVSGAAVLSGAAREVFDSAIKQYAVELLDEVSLYELQHRRNTSIVPQYTSAQVATAEVVIRNRGITVPGRSWWLVVGKVFIYILAIAIGVSSNLMIQSEPWLLPSAGWMAVFCLCVPSAVSVLVAIEVAEHKERNR